MIHQREGSRNSVELYHPVTPFLDGSWPHSFPFLWTTRVGKPEGCRQTSHNSVKLHLRGWFLTGASMFTRAAADPQEATATCQWPTPGGGEPVCMRDCRRMAGRAQHVEKSDGWTDEAAALVHPKGWLHAMSLNPQPCRTAGTAVPGSARGSRFPAGSLGSRASPRPIAPRAAAGPGPAHRPRPRRGRAAGSGPAGPPRPAALRSSRPRPSLFLRRQLRHSQGGGTGSDPSPAHGPGCCDLRGPRSLPEESGVRRGPLARPSSPAQRCRQPALGRAGPPYARSIAAARVRWAAHPWAPSPPRSPPPPTEPPSSSAPSPCQPPPRPSPHSTPVPEPRVTRAPAPPQTWRHWQRSSRSRWTEVSATAAAPRPRLSGRPARGPPRRAPALSPQLQRGSAPAPQSPGPAVAAGSGDAPPRGAQVGCGRRSETEEIKLCASRGRHGAGILPPAARRCRKRRTRLRGQRSAPEALLGAAPPSPPCGAPPWALPAVAPRRGPASPPPQVAQRRMLGGGTAPLRLRVWSRSLSTRAAFAGKMRLFGGLRGGVRGRHPWLQLVRSHTEERFCVFP